MTGHENDGYVTTEFGRSIIDNVDGINTESSKKKKKDSKDILTSVIGEWGKWQLALCLILGATNISIGWVNFANKFYNTKVKGIDNVSQNKKHQSKYP